MSTSTLPPAAATANETALSEALAAAHISDSPDTTAKDLPEEDKKDELEEGEIKEEEDDGSPKTVFDDARRFNLKVRADDVS
jgi:translation initiation factor 4E